MKLTSEHPKYIVLSNAFTKIKFFLNAKKLGVKIDPAATLEC